MGLLMPGFKLILILFIGCKCWLDILAEMISNGAKVNPVDEYDECDEFSGLKFVSNGE